MAGNDKTIVCTGLERLLTSPPTDWETARCGLLLNQASTDRALRLSSLCLVQWLPTGRLRKLFTPQHGMWGTQQANMCETDHGFDSQLGIPIYSLYSATRRPTPEMLEDLDVLFVDLQDVGTRVYTFASTVILCLQACAEANVAVHVLDRPNPLGGSIIEGPCLDMAWSSFVGMLPIPMRHGLTLGELSRLACDTLHIPVELHVHAMSGWCREMLFSDTGLPWIPPSPNMPRFDTALIYPGQVLLEGTNLSEGRGTTQPFELSGAPYIDPQQLLAAWTRAEEFGLMPRESHFVPTFDKWSGQQCGGLAWHWREPAEVRSYGATATMLAVIAELWPDQFRWSAPPYEYDWNRPPIDLISGGDGLRQAISDGAGQHDARLDALLRADCDAWWQRVGDHRLYE